MKRILILALLLATASVSPLIFPIAESGRSSMNVLAEVALLPAAVILLVTVGLLHRAHHSLAGISTLGLAAGAVATIALEAIRLPGFWLGYMPGNLPELMGVLLLNQFATGPTLGSNIVGWAYHFWNGNGLIERFAALNVYAVVLCERSRSESCKQSGCERKAA